MPFRTRDFALFLFTVAFLVVGITSTVHTDLASKQNLAAVASFDETEASYSAVLPEAASDERPNRLATLKKKIADLVLTPVVEEVVPEETPVEAPVAVTPGEVQLCSSYQSQTVSWQPQGLQFEVVEGARLVYREIAAVNTVNDLGETVLGVPTRTVLLQLPLRSFAVASSKCLSSDIVGVALDGSLIRNAEYAIYNIFGAETLIGYALDGFAIYGAQGAPATDSCGGATTAGSYRYYVSTEREGVLGCFSGEPVTI